MKHKHTRGPWILQPEYISQPSGKEATFVEPTVWAEMDSDKPKHVAVIRCGLQGSEANGILIAAAPELLECLRWVHPYFCLSMCDGRRQDSPIHNDGCKEAAALLKRLESL